MNKRMILLVCISVVLILTVASSLVSASSYIYLTHQQDNYPTYYQSSYSHPYYEYAGNHYKNYNYENSRYNIYFIEKPMKVQQQGNYVISYSHVPRSYHYQNETYADYYSGLGEMDKRTHWIY